jgi:SHS2 domain-containing protein
MGSNTCGFKELDHTADAAVQVWGNSLQAIFHQALLAFYAIAGVQDEIDADTTPKRMALHLHESDLEALLIAFLTELLYHLGDGILFDLQEISIQENALDAILVGKEGITVQREVKAITYHHLQIEFQDGIYKTEIVFDI